MTKKPKARYSPSAEKRSRAEADPESIAHRKPSWLVSAMDMGGPFGWNTVSADKLREIRGKLTNFESMTWGEILVQGKHSHHRIQVSDISTEARRRLEEIQQDDITELVSLRLSGKERILGIQDASALKILWWDPEHQVYPVSR